VYDSRSWPSDSDAAALSTGASPHLTSAEEPVRFLKGGQGSGVKGQGGHLNRDLPFLSSHRWKPSAHDLQQTGHISETISTHCFRNTRAMSPGVISQLRPFPPCRPPLGSVFPINRSSPISIEVTVYIVLQYARSYCTI